VTTTQAAGTTGTTPPGDAEIGAIHAWWRAANYLSVGQIYLRANPLLHEPLTLAHVKPRLLGHWGTSPGLTFVYAHLNRVIRRRDAEVIYIAGPGHGGPAMLACAWLEGTYSEVYPDVPPDAEGMEALFRQFSAPGGVPSHHAPESPGSIHEGGELGYALSHAYGAVLDNPGLVAACVIGDGEAETGALAASWHSNKFLDPVTDGAVLPILHLNGFKIANPTVLARIPEEELLELMRGYGHDPLVVAGDDPEIVHRRMAVALDTAWDRIEHIQRDARTTRRSVRPRWPMIILRTPKGWTGPREIDGHRLEGSWRSHQVPLAGLAEHPDHLAALETWLRSYRPEELFDEGGCPVPALREFAPAGPRRMSANPHTNGGLLRRSLRLPDLAGHGVAVSAPGTGAVESTRPLGGYLRDVMAMNADRRNFRLFGPDETASNRLASVFEVTGRAWLADTEPDDDAFLRPDGRVMEILSEQTLQGWLEGYLLTGRHGVFNTYEAFVHIVDSMFNQHAKWLKVIRDEVPWRAPIPSLNYLLSSHVWRQDHNGFSHQDPGFIDHVTNKKPDVIRVYLPPDANTLLVVVDRMLRSTNLVNVVVAGKHPAPQYLDLEAAALHVDRGIGIWDWAGTDADTEPDVVLACAGDVPTMETLAAAAILRQHLPDLAVRVVNVVDLMRLQPREEHPHGLSDSDFDLAFTRDRPVIFDFHGYPWLIHRLTYRRTNHPNIHVRGYKEEGSTTTPFDMAVRNQIDRFTLVGDVIRRVPRLGARAARLRQLVADRLITHDQYVRRHGEDMPEVRDWAWPASSA